MNKLKKITEDELIEKIEVWDIDYNDNDIVKYDEKSYLNLSGYDLEEFNLSNIRIFRVTFEGSNLKNVNFEDSYIYDVIFKNVNMQYSNIRNAGFEYANFNNADLKNVNFESVYCIDNSILDGALVYNSQKPAFKFSNIKTKGVGWVDDDEKTLPNVPFDEEIYTFSSAPDNGELFWLIAVDKNGIHRYPCHAEKIEGKIYFMYNSPSESCWVRLYLEDNDRTLFWQNMLEEEKNFFFLNVINGKLKYPEQKISKLAN